jgi:hypothetical protein
MLDPQPDPLLARIDEEIAKRLAAASENPSRLTDAELIRQVAEEIANFLSEPGILSEVGITHSRVVQAVACTFAIQFFQGPDKSETLAQAADLLNEIGLEFEPEQLRATAESDAFSEFKKLWGWGFVNEPNPEHALRALVSALEAGYAAGAPRLAGANT